MPDNDKAVRAQKLQGLLGNDGWHEYVAITQEKLARLAKEVMAIETRRPGWEEEASQGINKYQAIKGNVESVERLIKKERERKEKAEEAGE